eukprot:CAMPEP_0179126632 /NCGR_PEP_ID=MMETSP0796-20121207/59949_1 /TAXON_ID=73915 /ORGANISM="Pyrodinium bahamense, Strain pbaha01" /LENGTH=300 /DNA_ID=CAMNT_0020825387 /DNA_START=53 /DNA_END=955 /DNA_ORIENTATION=-
MALLACCHQSPAVCARAALLFLSIAWAAATTSVDTVSLLQVAITEKPALQRKRDLAMAYVPYNFGHTVAAVAARRGIQWGDCGSRFGSPAACLGHRRSEVTGCELMYTPAKHWPQDEAHEVFGNRTVFGILRDPYERLVAQFRGSGLLSAPDLYLSCDVSGYVKRTLKKYLADGNPYANNCQALPQAEFFDQPFGATVAVDNRRFPESANELLTDHGYTDILIQHGDVAHVSGCDHKWAGDLDEEARALVREVYARDFYLLCQHFGYCDTEENVCLTHIKGMCPEQLFSWNKDKMVYERI